MSTSSAVSRSAGRRTGPVVAALADRADLPLVLVAAAEAERRGAALALVEVTAPRSRWSIGATRAPVPDVVPNRSEPDSGLRDRALTLAQLSGAAVSWTSAAGRPDVVLARYCRDHHAALIVVGASRHELATWRRRRVLAAAQRLGRRARTPIHIITT